MKALVLDQDDLHIREIKTPQPQSDEVLIKISAAALNRRDQWIREGLYAKIQLPAVLGSDGCGHIISIGSNVPTTWLNKRVIINPNIHWGDNPKAQSKAYQILGMPTQGAFAEYLCVPVDRVIEAPKHLTDIEAAALPLGGLTAYNAIVNKGQLSPNKKVLISGVGGGVAQFAFQFALAVKAPVWVTSGKDDVIQKCIRLGAQDGANYKTPQSIPEMTQAAGKFDLIIDSACGEGMNDLLKCLTPGGRYVFYGATQGVPPKLNVHAIFWNQLAILGSTMGSDADFEAMVSLVNKSQIAPIIDQVFPLTEGIKAFDRIKSGKNFGKIVLSLKQYK